MSCQTCGYPAERVNSQFAPQGHHYGCAEAMKPLDSREQNRAFVEKALDNLGLICEHSECSNPKRPQGKGPKPKYCDEHSTPKSRKE